MNSFNLATDYPFVLFAQPLQPRANRFISRFRSVKNHFKRHIGIHAKKCTIFGTLYKPLIMKARNLKTDNFAAQRGREVMWMSSWSYRRLIQCDSYLVTNTMRGRDMHGMV